MTRLDRQRLITERLSSMSIVDYYRTCNGVGPKMTLWLGGDGLSCIGVIPFARWLHVPARIQRLLRGAADLHDTDYDEGGTEIEKMWADTWFLANSLDAVYSQDNTALVDSWLPRRAPKRLRPWLIKAGCFLVRLHDRLWAYLCYTLVRVLGGQFFNYR